MKTSLKWLIAAGLSVALVGAWLTASAMSSNKVAQMLNSTASQGLSDASFKIRNLHHQAGWFSSQGDLELAYVDKCNPLTGDDVTWVQVEYKLSHLLLPTSLMRFEWTLQPTGDAKAAFEKVFQGKVALSGKGHLRAGQSFDTDLNLPALTLHSAESHFEMAPTKGFISVKGNSLLVEISSDKTKIKGNGQTLEIQQVNLSVDLDNRQNGTGTSSIRFGKINGSDLTLEGLKITSKAQESHDRLSMSLSYNLDKAAYQQHWLSDLAISYAINGLHSESVNKLIALSGTSCGFQHMTSDEELQMRAALKSLLLQGLSTGFTTLTAKLEDGKLEGKLMLDLHQNDSGRVELGQHLKLLGVLQVDGQVLSPDQQKSIVDIGFAKPSAQGLVSSIDYSNSQLKLNDKDFNSPMVEMMLTELENKINDWLDNVHPQHKNSPMVDWTPELPEADPPAAESPSPATDS